MTITDLAPQPPSAIDRPRLTVLGTGLPRRHPRHLHGRARLRRPRRRHRPRPRSRPSPPAGVPFFEPGLPEMLAQGARLRPAAVHHRPGRGRRASATCTSSASARRSARTRAGADLRYVEGVIRDLAPYLRRRCLVVGKSTVPVGTAARLTQLLQDNAPAGHGRRAGVEPGVPARGLRRRGHPAARTAWSSASARRGPRGSSRRRFAPAARGRRTPSSPPTCHRRAGQGRGQLVPGHQDLLHQRDGRGLRGDGRRRPDAGQGAVLRQPDRRPVPQARSRLRRRLPAQGHPGLHPPRRGARGRQVGRLPPPGRRDQQPAPRAHRRPRPRAGRRRASTGVRVCCLGAAFKPELRRHPGRPRARRGPDAPAGGRRSCRSTTPRRWTTPAGPTPTSHYADGVMEAADGRHGRGPAHRVGPVPLHRPRPRSARSSPADRSSTAGTPSTPTPGARPAGATARSAAPAEGHPERGRPRGRPQRGRPLPSSS